MTKFTSRSAASENRKHKLTSKGRAIIIFVSLLVSLLLVFGVMTFNLQKTYQNAENEVFVFSKNNFAENAGKIDTFFIRHTDVLITSSEALEHLLLQENVTNEDVEDMLRSITKSYSKEVYEKTIDNQFDGVFAVINGSLLHGGRASSELPEKYNPTDRQWYQEGITGGGEVVFGEPYADIYDPNQIDVSATKMLSDGVSVIGMDITMDDLRAMIDDIDVSVSINGNSNLSGYGFIMTGNGIVMAHSGDATQQFLNYSDPQSPMYDVYKYVIDCSDYEVNNREIQLDGDSYWLFTQKLSNGWYAVTLTDLADLDTSIYDFSSGMLLATILVMLIALVYCGLITRDYFKADKLSKSLQDTIELATKDALTGLLNREAYYARIKELSERMASDKDFSFAAVMLDLNDLKLINDHYGHAEGDQYIIKCCNLLKDIFSCELYRIGGDEFALFLTDEAFEHWEDLFRRLRLAVAAANMSFTPSMENPSIAVGVSIHRAGSPENIEDLLKQADTEMYKDKVSIKQARLGHDEKGYIEDVKLKLSEKQILAEEVKRGLEEEQFEVWFHPQVNHSNNGTLIGAEALVRWRHPEQGMISPTVFIPLFEYNGLIYELDKYVWKHACAYIRKAMDDGVPPLPVSVNVSRYDIIQEGFIETITSIVEEQQIPYDLVHLEVTESAFSDDSGEVARVVNKLIDRGFIIAIDDFGSGYSSLSLLRNVPAHIVKLDMRFFADGENQKRNECIIESIIRMVKILGMSIISEGVEHVEQANLLNTLGCAYIQGYLYSKPLPYEQFVAYTRAAISEKINRDSVKTREEIDCEYVQSQRMFHNIIAGTGEVVIVADINTKQLLYANRAAEQYFGKRFDPINPTTCMEYCERGELCKHCPAKALKPRERREFFTSEDGKHLKTLYVQMDWNGHDAFVYYQTDITAQMQELEFSDALIRNIPGATIAFELGKDGNPQIRYISDNAMKMFAMAGINDKTPVCNDIFNITHPEDREYVRKASNALFSEKKPFRESFRIMLKNGSVMWVDALVNPVADRDGSYLFYGIYTDITDSKNAQEHLDAVLQSIPAAITIYEITKTGANRVFISDRAKDVLMITSERHEKRSVGSLYSRVHKDDRQRVQAITQECFKEGKPFSIQFRIISDDGIVRWLQLDSQPIESGNKEDARLFYSIYTDISEQKQLEINAGLSVDRLVVENTINFGLQEAMKQSSPELSVDYIVRFVGRVLHGERAYIFEMNPDRTNSNTYEWVADGITPEKENLQNLPEELSRPWYEQFEKQNIVIIEDLEDIKATSPELYEALSVQDIHSLIVAPLFDNHGTPMGFFGIDNPPKELLSRNSNLMQTIAYYIEAVLKRKNLNNHTAQ